MSGRACLLLSPSAAWDPPQLDCPDAEAERLRSGRVGDQSWHLLDWLPRDQSGVLRLVTANGRIGSFTLQVDPSKPHVWGISDVQLQGRQPSQGL